MPTALPTDTLRSAIEAELPSLIAIRHELHRRPELAYQEHRTSQFVQRELAALGIEFKAGLARGTGVVGYLPPTDRSNAGPSVALRADMDALPIAEATGKPYASETPGVMHACGHDGHMTILLGAARVLSRMTHRPNGVTFVFQPAEENGAGAEKMCDDGALLGAEGGGVGAPVGRIFGLHGWPQLPVGTLASKPGPLLAATDEFEVEIRGRGGHAAYPQLGADPVVAAAQVITALQSIASRNVPPVEALVVTVAYINGGTASNIIPDAVTFGGTVRTHKEEVRRTARERFMMIVEATAAAMGCKATVRYDDGYPVTVNDAELTERFFRVAREVAGEAMTRRVEHASMGGEDFSYYGQRVPACFFLLGLRPEGMERYPSLHQPEFDFNDEVIGRGVEMMCRLAVEG